MVPHEAKIAVGYDRFGTGRIQTKVWPQISLILHGLRQPLSQRLWFEAGDHGMPAK
jgi:hypothetical protein